MPENNIEVKKGTPAAKSAAGSPWNLFRNEFDQMFDRFTKGMLPWKMPLFGETRPAPMAEWADVPLPCVDVTETPQSYKVTAELPGLTAQDVDVSVVNGNLVIKGEKQKETKQETENYYLRERSYGAFERSFYLPEGVDRDHIKAEVAKGVLTVILPKTEAAQKAEKKIEVKAG